MIIAFIQTIENQEEREFLTEIYNKYSRLMYSTAKEVLGDDEAEDAVMDAFVAISKNIKKISKIFEDDRHKAVSYIVIIVKRKAIDILRRRQREQNNVTSIENLGAIAAADEIDVFGAIESAPLMLMNRLSPKHREFLYLRHVCGLQSHEIADMFGISNDSVRCVLWRARETLKKELKKEGILC